MGVDGLSRSDSNRSTLPGHGNSLFHHHRTLRLNQDAQSCRKSVDDFSRGVFNRHRCRSGNSSFGIIAQARPETFNRPDALRGRDWGLHACSGERPHPQKPSVAGADKLRTTRCRMVFTAQTLRDSAVRPKRRHRTTPPTAVLREDPREDTTTFNRPWLKSQWPGGEDRNGTRSRSVHGNRCSDRRSRSRKPRLEAPAKVTVARGKAQQSKEHATLVSCNPSPRGACPEASAPRDP